MQTKMDKKVINDDLDELVDKRLAKIERKKAAAARASLKGSVRGSDKSCSSPNSPFKLKTVLEQSNLENSRSSIAKSPLKMFAQKTEDLEPPAMEKRSSIVKSLLKNSV